MIFLQFKGIIYYHTNLPKRRIIMPKFNPKMSLSDIHNNLNLSFENKPSSFLKLLEKNILFDSFIPDSFNSVFYKSMGRKHIYILNLSNELRIFCRFDKVPDASQFSRFRTNYHTNLADMFKNLVDITEPICRKINEKKAKYLIYDTSGIELPVKENNPKFLETKLNEAKKFSTKKDSSDSSSYAIAYSKLPDCASANLDVRQQYINGHFCYALKFGILTNGLGIPRFVSFFDDDFKSAHPETTVKKTDNPDIDKEVADAKSLKPVLTDFIAMHPELEFKTFLADSAFDSYEIFAMLRDSFKFSRVCIPINKRNAKLEPVDFNKKGIPVCPLTKEPFIYQGITHEKGRSDRIKWTCNKAKPFNKGKFVCDNPCTSSKYGRCVYTSVDKNFRLCPGIHRDTEHWKNLYRHRVQIERTINLIKDTFCVNYRKSYRTVSAKSNVYLAVITQLIGVILADAIHQLKNFKSIRKLIAS